jgi:hypothetical protein
MVRFVPVSWNTRCKQTRLIIVDHCGGLVPFMSSAMSSAANPAQALLDKKVRTVCNGITLGLVEMEDKKGSP